jgi:AbiV family abortive infection protein
LAKAVKIPRVDLIPGVRLCLEQGRELLESSLLLVDAGKLDAAANEYSIGAQEIGKAKLLRDAYDSGVAQPDVAGFFDHAAKVDAARTVLGSSALWLKNGIFDHRVFDANVFDVAVPADEMTRREVLYVDYGTTGWRKPPPIDAGEFRGHIVDALSALPTIEVKLTR